MRSFTGEVLREAGYRVLTAADGTEAIEVAPQARGTIDLLVTDVGMPGFGGVGLADALLREVRALLDSA